MINFKQQMITKNITYSYTCDKCKKEIMADDEMEAEEIFTIIHACGYGTVFSDDTVLQAEFCQQCAKELFGKYLREIK